MFKSTTLCLFAINILTICTSINILIICISINILIICISIKKYNDDDDDNKERIVEHLNMTGNFGGDVALLILLSLFGIIILGGIYS